MLVFALLSTAFLFATALMEEKENIAFFGEKYRAVYEEDKDVYSLCTLNKSQEPSVESAPGKDRCKKKACKAEKQSPSNQVNSGQARTGIPVPLLSCF